MAGKEITTRLKAEAGRIQLKPPKENIILQDTIKVADRCRTFKTVKKLEERKLALKKLEKVVSRLQAALYNSNKTVRYMFKKLDERLRGNSTWPDMGY